MFYRPWELEMVQKTPDIPFAQEEKVVLPPVAIRKSYSGYHAIHDRDLAIP
jgi:hypothetical protein